MLKLTHLFHFVGIDKAAWEAQPVRQRQERERVHRDARQARDGERVEGHALGRAVADDRRERRRRRRESQGPDGRRADRGPGQRGQRASEPRVQQRPREDAADDEERQRRDEARQGPRDGDVEEVRFRERIVVQVVRRAQTSRAQRRQEEGRRPLDAAHRRGAGVAELVGERQGRAQGVGPGEEDPALFGGAHAGAEPTGPLAPAGLRLDPALVDGLGGERAHVRVVRRERPHAACSLPREWVRARVRVQAGLGRRHPPGAWRAFAYPSPVTRHPPLR